MDYLLGIDIGTSSCKTLLLESSGRVVDCIAHEYPILSPKYGWAEQNPDDWYKAFKLGLNQILAKNTELRSKIAGIGLTGQMIGLVLTGRRMEVLYPSIIWMDQRSLSQVEYLKKNFKQIINSITLNPINVSNTLPKIMWVKDNLKEVWEKTHKILLPKDYIRLRLTGEWCTDLNDASGTLLLDVNKKNWSDTIIECVKIEKNKLPDLLPSIGISGYVTKEASEDLGIRSGIPVIAGSGDLAAENYAAGILNPSQRLTRMGTASSTSTVIEKPYYDKNDIARCYIYCIPDKWIIETTNQAFGLCEKWFRDTFFSEEKKTAQKEKKSVYEIMDRMASEIKVGSDGLIFHQFNSGEPYWNPYLRGAFYGIGMQHDKRHFSRAVLEGSAYGLKDAINFLEKISKKQVLKYTLVGGGSKSKIWSQIICDVLKKDAYVLKTADAALGAAMMAGVGTEIFKDFEDSINRCLEIESIIKYDKENSKIYDKIFKIYKIIHNDLMRKSYLIKEMLN